MFRSTKGASKQRRDCINHEINEIKQNLPLTESVRRRLSQLQVMALCKAYIQKTNSFQNAVHFDDNGSSSFDNHDFTDALPGFLTVTNLEGRVLYISENVTEYIGHSMVELMTQAETIYDIIDRADHTRLSSFLLDAKAACDVMKCDDVIDFVTGINLSALFRRNNVFDKQKRMKLHGKVIWPEGELNLSEPVFVVRFTAKLSNVPTEPAVSCDTMIFQSRHSLDMKYVSVDNIGEYHMGFNKSNLTGKSWYSLIHPNFIEEAMACHTELMNSPGESSKSMIVQMQTSYGSFLWVHIVMRLVHNTINMMNNENGSVNPQEIICLNHIMDEQEALETKHQEQMDSLFAMEDQYDASYGMPKIPVVVVEETLNDVKPVTDVVNHQELLRKLRDKAQEKNKNKKIKMMPCFEDKEQPTNIMPSLMNLCDYQSPLTPPYSDDGVSEHAGAWVPAAADYSQRPYTTLDDGISDRAMTWVPSPGSCTTLDSGSSERAAVWVPSPSNCSQGSCSPPYSPPNFSFHDDYVKARQLEEENFFETGMKPGVVFEKRLPTEHKNGLFLPVLDHSFVESYLQDMEYYDVIRLSDAMQQRSFQFVQERSMPVSKCNYGGAERAQQIRRDRNPLIEDIEWVEDSLAIH